INMNSLGSESNEEDCDLIWEEKEEDKKGMNLVDKKDYYVGVTSDLEQGATDALEPSAYQESVGAFSEHMTSLASVLKARDAHYHQLHPPNGTGQLITKFSCS
uniref:Uncharacterized protein n=1 Tax=Prolemur simus TaxID=1328070 RepID=A0A8C9AJL7_PROSS